MRLLVEEGVRQRENMCESKYVKRVWDHMQRASGARLDFGLGFVNKAVAGVGGVGTEVVKATKKSHIIRSATERRNIVDSSFGWMEGQ